MSPWQGPWETVLNAAGIPLRSVGARWLALNEVAIMGLPGQPVEGSEGESVGVLGESTT